MFWGIIHLRWPFWRRTFIIELFRYSLYFSITAIYYEHDVVRIDLVEGCLTAEYVTLVSEVHLVLNRNYILSEVDE